MQNLEKDNFLLYKNYLMKYKVHVRKMDLESAFKSLNR